MKWRARDGLPAPPRKHDGERDVDCEAVLAVRHAEGTLVSPR